MSFKVIKSGNWFHVWNVKSSNLVTKTKTHEAAVNFIKLLGGKVTI